MMGPVLESVVKCSHNLRAFKVRKHCGNTLFLLEVTALEPYGRALQSPGKENMAQNFLHL